MKDLKKLGLSPIDAKTESKVKGGSSSIRRPMHIICIVYIEGAKLNF